jgi:Tfp pilus assembly protein PilF
MNHRQAFDLALQHHQSGRLLEAEALYRQVLEAKPRHPDALHMLGVVADQVGQGDDAVKLFRQAIALRPRFPEAQSNLGIALYAMRRLDEAIAAYRQAVALKPDYAEAHYNLGIALSANGESDEAIAAYRRALAILPNYPDALDNLAYALFAKGEFDASIATYRQCATLKPDYYASRKNLGIVLLLQEQFPEGWQEYECRLKTKELGGLMRNFVQSKWEGEPLEGRTILLQAEQGIGDVIQFIRYLPMVRERGGRVTLQCQAPLKRLLRVMDPDLPVFECGQPLPPFDTHCPLLSLPRIFATDLASIPQQVPYLHASAEDAASWRARLAEHGSSLKVGLVWAGSPAFKADLLRSPRQLSVYAPLGGVGGVQFFSLQKGDAARQAKTPPAGMTLHDWTDDLRDFADTAALMENLDLIISSDTSVVHLAGAIGKPVWALLPSVPDWRWFLGRSDSPWYPTMRLFRQQRPMEWGSVIASVREQLQSLVAARE